MPYAEPFETIRRKARYGHYDVIVWRDKTGAVQWARKSVESLKAALLATGTQKSFSYYAADTAFLTV